MQNGKPVAVVAGAGPGNGAALARRFAEAGYAVALLARGRDALAAFESEIAGTRGYPCDVGDAASVERAFAAIVGTVSTQISVPGIMARPMEAKQRHARRRRANRIGHFCA